MPGVRQRVAARFVLSGFPQDPEAITRSIGILPTKTWKQGDPLPAQHGGSLARRANTWVVESDYSGPYDPSTALESHILSILDKLRPGWNELAALCDEYEASIDCVIRITPDNIPAISVTKNIVEEIADLHAAIDIDLYIDE